jgi:proteic killer suppression protein
LVQLAFGPRLPGVNVDLIKPFALGQRNPPFADDKAAGYALGYRKAFLDNRKPLPYKMGVIRSFRGKTLERFFATGDGRRLSVQDTKRIANILRSLDDALRPEDMNLPGFRFHALVGRDKGRYAVSGSGNWRMTFGWIEGDVDVDLED